MRKQALKRSKQIKIFLLCQVAVLIVTIPVFSVNLGDNIFSPYIQSSTLGWIDWDQGYIYGIGHGFTGNNNKASHAARRAAGVVAAANILKLAYGIAVDDSTSLEKMKTGSYRLDLEGFIRDEEVESKYHDSDNPYWKVVRRTPIKGVHGLTARVFDHMSQHPSNRSPADSSSFGNTTRFDDTPEETWLVLDARKLTASNQVRPALFPKIMTELGKVVYDKNMVDKDSLISNGMVRYVTTGASKTQLESKSSDHAQLTAMLAKLIGPDDAWAEDKKKKRKRRKKFIVKDVEKAQGLTKTNLIINEKDASNLKKEDNASGILKKCRVIVVLSSPLGGIEGSREIFVAGL